MSKEKIYRLSINNFLTVEKMTFDLAGVKGFVGKNAQGKSNILLSLETLLRGDSNTNLIKDGKDKYEIRLDEIINDEVVSTVKRVQNEKGNILTGKISGSKYTPKRYLETLLDDVAVNPIRFIEENPVKYLKSHLVAPIQEGDILPHNFADLEFDMERNVFNECRRHQDFFERERVEMYGKLRHAKELCSELQKTLPEKSKIPESDKDKLMSELSEVTTKIGKAEKAQERLKEIEADIKRRDLKVNEYRDEYSAEKESTKDLISNIKSEHEKKIEVINSNIDAIKKSYEDNVLESKAKANNRLAEIEKEIEALNQERNKINKVDLPERLKSLEEKRDNYLKLENDKLETEEKDYPGRVTDQENLIKAKLSGISHKAETEKEEIKKLEDEKIKIDVDDFTELSLKKQQLENDIKQLDSWVIAKEGYKNLEKHEKEVERINKEYEELDVLFKHYAYDLPKQLITRCDLPVEGLEFKDDELYVKGRIFNRLSEGERMMYSVKLAVELARRKGHIAVCLDGIEILDPNNKKELMDYLSNSNIAVLYTRQGEPEYDHEVEIEKGQVKNNNKADRDEGLRP